MSVPEARQSRFQWFHNNWISKKIDSWNDGIVNLKPPTLRRKLRMYSTAFLFLAFVFLLLNMLSCALIPGRALDLVHLHVTVGKAIETLHLGTFGYCLNEHCFKASKGFFYKIGQFSFQSSHFLKNSSNYLLWFQRKRQNSRPNQIRSIYPPICNCYLFCDVRLHSISSHFGIIFISLCKMVCKIGLRVCICGGFVWYHIFQVLPRGWSQCRICPHHDCHGYTSGFCHYPSTFYCEECQRRRTRTDKERCKGNGRSTRTVKWIRRRTRTGNINKKCKSRTHRDERRSRKSPTVFQCDV